MPDTFRRFHWRCLADLALADWSSLIDYVTSERPAIVSAGRGLSGGGGFFWLYFP
jgi:hypothetical protein